MKKTCVKIASWIRILIDFCYPPFRRYMTLQFFRYGVTGATNLVFDWVLYFCIYNFILQHHDVVIGSLTISSHIASLGIKFPIIFFSGFLLQKHITFSHSKLLGRVQLFRYLVVFIVNLIINFIGLKLLVDGFNIYPTPSNMIVSVFTVLVSYFSQKKYTFKTTKN